jgi:methylglutaconyl-CoA hydratase
MKTAGSVTVEIHDSIAFVRFEHPKSNSLPGALLRTMADDITKLGQMTSVKTIVLRSSGDGAFCAGASFDELKEIRNAEDGKEFFSGFAKVMLAMTRAPQFVLTRVHGKVTGGGVGLIAASDYSVAVKGASLKLSELAVGIGPFVIGPVVERRLGTGAFTDMAIDADWREASWAARHGLYSHVYEDVESMDTALAKLVNFLAAANPEAIRQMKKTFWADTAHWEELLEKRAAISGALAMSIHTRAAIEKFQAR